MLSVICDFLYSTLLLFTISTEQKDMLTETGEIHNSITNKPNSMQEYNESITLDPKMAATFFHRKVLKVVSLSIHLQNEKCKTNYYIAHAHNSKDDHCHGQWHKRKVCQSGSSTSDGLVLQNCLPMEIYENPSV